jgi:hypothetical protein
MFLPTAYKKCGSMKILIEFVLSYIILGSKLV